MKLEDLLNSLGQPLPVTVAVGIGIVVLIAAVVAALKIAKARSLRAAIAESVLDPSSQVAAIVEQQTLTWPGRAAVVLLLMNWVGSLYAFVNAQNANQETVALLIWIGGTVMFGFFARLGVERRLSVYSLRDD